MQSAPQGSGQSETVLVPAGLIGPATPPVTNRSSREVTAMTPTSPFGKVSYKPVERNAEGKEVKRRTGVAQDLTPYAEFIKVELAEHPDEWILLEGLATGEIIKKGDTGATKKSIGRGREEYKHAKAFEDAAKQVLGLGQPKIEFMHFVPEEDSDDQPTTTLSMRFYQKRIYTPEQDNNRRVGQAESRVTRANNKAKSAKLAADADPDNTELAEAYKLAASRLTAARKALKELKGNGEGK